MSLADYRITFGKYRGKRLRSFNIALLKNYVAHLKLMDIANERPFSKELLHLEKVVLQYEIEINGSQPDLTLGSKIK